MSRGGKGSIKTLRGNPYSSKRYSMPTNNFRKKLLRLASENPEFRKKLIKTLKKASFVNITREEFEGWLNSLNLKWSLKDGTQGIYWIPFSERVALKISSSIGSRDNSMGLGKASMQMRLISRITGQVLNKKAQEVSHFKRTLNWRRTLTLAVKKFIETYQQSPDFYERIADPPKMDPRLLQRMRNLWLEARAGRDQWTMTFVHSCADQYKKRGFLSEKQMQILEDKFRLYQV